MNQRVNGILVNGSLVVSALLAISVHSALLFGWEWDTAPYADIPAAREQGISIDLTQAPKLKVDKTPDLPAGTVNQPVRKQPDIPEPAPEPAPVPKPEKIPRPKAQPQLPQSTPPSQTRQTAETPNSEPGSSQSVATSPEPWSALSSPKPEYPEPARRRGQEGLVRLRANIDAQGMLLDLVIEQSSGYPLLDEAALKAIRKWRFRPGTRNGEAVAGSVVIPVEFQLKR